MRARPDHMPNACGDRAASATLVAAPAGTQRLVSLDAFRGITIGAMIVVNNPGNWNAVYRPLAHAEWNGCTLADLVFPFFLFIVGVSITLSLGRRPIDGAELRATVGRIVRRSILLFVLGIFLNGFPGYDLRTLRVFGVLQRIALCYFFAALLSLVTEAPAQAAAAGTLLAGYWLLMKLVPVPGAPAGVLDPQLNLAAFVDDRLLHGHLHGGASDPEGLLTTIPAISTTLLGVLAGRWMQCARDPQRRLLGLVAAGILCAATGLVAAAWFPLNKQLWSPSYVLFTGGLALLVLSVGHAIVDVRGHRAPALPFLVLGTNALTVYLLSTAGARLLDVFQTTSAGATVPVRVFLYERLFAWAGGAAGSLLFAVAYLLVWFAPMGILYRKRVFIRL